MMDVFAMPKYYARGSSIVAICAIAGAPVENSTS
jgi:hypothetical protein